MMNARRIIYICNYNRLNDRFLNIQPSTATKVDYISRAINEAGHKLYIYSMAEAVQGMGFSYPSREVIESDDRTVYYPRLIRRKSVISKILSKILIVMQLCCFLLCKAKRSDIILVYHSLIMTQLVKSVAEIRKLALYIEVEEVYNAVYRNTEKSINKEIENLRGAEGYICVNDVMHDKLRLNGRSVSCYGNYNMCSGRKRSEPCSNPIHIVYAGVLGEDSFLAIDSAALLPAGYHLHVLGYGSQKMIESHLTHIERKKSADGASITYDGCLSGKEYEDFLSECQIALCTRTLENEYSDYTFPSKVLVYLNYNLRVVCTPVNCVLSSKVAGLINFSDGIDPNDIAKEILDIDVNSPFYASQTLDRLHFEFVSDLKKLFK